MTGKDLIFEIINQNALKREISIEINKHSIPESSCTYEYFNVVDVVASGHELILHTEAEQ